MKTIIRSALIAASAIANLASPFSALASPFEVSGFVATYSQPQSVNDPSQDYIDGLSGKRFIAVKREAHRQTAPDAGNAYIESFSLRSHHAPTYAGSQIKINDALDRPSALIR